MLATLLVAASFLAAQAPDEGGSLEDLLRRARAGREVEHARLLVEVERIVAGLEVHAGTAPQPQLDALQGEIDQLGTEAAMLLLPYVDPGAEPDDPKSFRASEVTSALVRLRAPGIIDELIRRSGTGSSTSRLHAVRILGTCPESARASTYLAGLFRDVSGEMRLEVVAALARQGGKQNASLLRSALTDDDPKVVATVLEALAGAQSVDAAPAVLNLTRVTAAAKRVVPEIIGYYRACPETVGEDEMRALVRLALASEIGVPERVLLLGCLPEFEEAKGTGVRRQLAPLFGEPNTTLREAALICATILGERNARRDLLRDYDQVVDDNQRWPEAYQRRGDVYLSVQEFSSAIRDYKRALELLKGRALQSGYRSIWTSMARAYVRSGRLREAHKTLKDSALDATQLAELAADPDFAPLLESPRYSDVFD